MVTMHQINGEIPDIPASCKIYTAVPDIPAVTMILIRLFVTISSTIIDDKYMINAHETPKKRDIETILEGNDSGAIFDCICIEVMNT